MKKEKMTELMQLYKTCEEVIKLIEENLDVFTEKGTTKEFETVLNQLLNQIQEIKK